MKILRIVSLILFLLTVIAFGSYRRIESKSKDTLGPEITYESDGIEVSVNAPVEELLKGVTAIDDRDGNVSDSILIEKISRFTDTGNRTITYAAFDLNNNITKVERELGYNDYTSPRFVLSQPLRFPVGDTDNIVKYMTVQDSLDGDLTDKIKYEGIKYGFGQSEGTYDIEFQVTNSAGDTSYLLTKVEFYYPGYQNQEYLPKIHLSDYIVYIKAGDSMDPKAYLTEVTIGQKRYSFQEGFNPGAVSTISKNEIKVNSNVNVRISGVYDIEYSFTTEDGYTGVTRLLVVVEE